MYLSIDVLENVNFDNRQIFSYIYRIIDSNSSALYYIIWRSISTTCHTSIFMTFVTVYKLSINSLCCHVDIPMEKNWYAIWNSRVKTCNLCALYCQTAQTYDKTVDFEVVNVEKYKSNPPCFYVKLLFKAQRVVLDRTWIFFIYYVSEHTTRLFSFQSVCSVEWDIMKCKFDPSAWQSFWYMRHV